MTLQMIGEVKYAPSRDLLYLWPEVIRNVADRLEDEADPALHAWLKKQGVTMDDLGAAVGAYCAFMNESHLNPEKRMTQVLEDSGWWQTRWEARHAMMYYAGVLITGIFFQGSRDATGHNGEALPTVKALITAGARLEAYARLPAWRRWLHRRAAAFRSWFMLRVFSREIS